MIPYVYSVLGPHAGQSVEEIFRTKQRQILTHGYCYWLQKSYEAKPEMFKDFTKEQMGVCFFLEATRKGKAARPTTTAQEACKFSSDKTLWEDIPVGIGPTGKLPAYALVLNSISYFKEPTWIDPKVRFMLGKSTILAEPQITSNNNLDGKGRKVVAVATLIYPFCVHVK